MLYCAVFLFSASSLMIEVLLVRFFSIAQWHHLYFMVISIALFGFGASGIFLNIVSRIFPRCEKRLTSSAWILSFLFLFWLCVVGSFFIINSLPLDYFEISLDIVQIFYLLITFLLFSLPFFLAGFICSLAYASLPEKTGTFYFTSMLGSTCGAIMPLLLLPFLGEGGCIILASLLPGILLIFPKKNIIITVILFLAIFPLSIFLIFYNQGKLITVKTAPRKVLSQLLMYPESRIVETSHSILGKIDVVACPSIRFAPGMSLWFTGQLPRQHSAIIDGDSETVLYELEQEKDLEFIRYTLPYSGYVAVAEPNNVLVIQKGGGSAIVAALSSGAPQITLIEENPSIAEICRQNYRFSYISIIDRSSRIFLAQDTLFYDIIHIENWGASLPGMASLNQEYLFTLEAFRQYFARLSGRGVVIISRKLLLPPCDSLRLFATALEALSQSGLDNPQTHLVMLRNWGIFTLLISKLPFSSERLENIKSFAQKMNFDFIYYPDLKTEEANRFNVLEEPFYFQAVNKVLRSIEGQNDFFSDYYLDVTPQSDDRPFVSRFIKWDRLPELNQAKGGMLYSLLISGEIVVLMVLAVALLVCLVLLIFPVIITYKRGRGIHFFQVLYFLAIGAGFMFLEIAFIKQYTFVLGNPVLSFTIVLCAMLVLSGVGGFISQRLKSGHILLIFLIVIIYIILLAVFNNSFIHLFMGLADSLRLLLVLIIMMPISIFVGMPFSLGMRLLLTDPAQRAYSWAANGSTSVLSSIIAVPIAFSIGISAVIFFSALAYGTGLLAFIKLSR